MSEDKSTKNNVKFLDISSKLILIYLALKLIIFPIIQTGINIIPNVINQEKIALDSVKIPELTFPDIILIVIIFLFQPQASKIFESFDLSSTGIKTKFRDLEYKMDETKAQIDEFQQQQITEIKEFQQFMYQLLLTSKEIEKLEKLKENTDSNTIFDFYVTQSAAQELRRLRDSKLIKLKSPFQYISDLEKASNYGSNFIDLTKYCEITELGKQFLVNLEKNIDANNAQNFSIEQEKNKNNNESL